MSYWMKFCQESGSKRYRRNSEIRKNLQKKCVERRTSFIDFIDQQHGPGIRLHVRQSLWRGKEQEPKTQAAGLDVDVTKELAALLAKFIREPQGWLLVLRGGRQPTIATKHSSGQSAPHFS